jgi:hypothetical protein
VSTDRIYLLVAFLAGAVTYLLLTSCTTIGHQPPPADWPQLEEKILYVNGATLHEYCGKASAWSEFSFACARISFARKVCYVILPEQTADGSQPWLLAHEREHCAGRDHEGSHSIADAWEKWKTAEAIKVWQSPR